MELKCYYFFYNTGKHHQNVKIKTHKNFISEYILAVKNVFYHISIKELSWTPMDIYTFPGCVPLTNMLLDYIRTTLINLKMLIIILIIVIRMAKLLMVGNEWKYMVTLSSLCSTCGALACSSSLLDIPVVHPCHVCSATVNETTETL